MTLTPSAVLVVGAEPFDAAYRAELVSMAIDQTLAFQTRDLRAKRGWSKAELARRAGVSWRVIHNLEDPGYDHGSFTLPTLVKVAQAFDVGLTASFRPFSDWLTAIANCVPPVGFTEDFSLNPDSPRNARPRSVFPWPTDG